MLIGQVRVQKYGWFARRGERRAGGRGQQGGFPGAHWAVGRISREDQLSTEHRDNVAPFVAPERDWRGARVSVKHELVASDQSFQARLNRFGMLRMDRSAIVIDGL